MLLSSLIDKNHNCIWLEQPPKLDLTVSSRSLCCSNSEHCVLNGSWNSVRQTTASALASAWHRVVDFNPETRFATGAFDDDMINNHRTSIQNQYDFLRL